MTADETWRPLGVDTDDQIAEYDALHDGVQPWMRTAFWMWVGRALFTRVRTRPSFYGETSLVEALDVPLVEHLGQRLRLPLPGLHRAIDSSYDGAQQVDAAVAELSKHPHPLQIADYLLAHAPNPSADVLNDLLDRSKSAWTVGERAGRPGLVRRVPEGVQTASDGVMRRAGQAGVRLARAWEELYGLDANASEAYRLAILAVEDASVPVVSPTNARATLGTVLAQIESQSDWSLPMEREHDNAQSREVVVGMMRMLWHGQHDRHGGQPSAPGNVSMDEARVAVSLAVTLVDWFSAGLVRRSTS